MTRLQSTRWQVTYQGEKKGIDEIEVDFGFLGSFSTPACPVVIEKLVFD